MIEESLLRSNFIGRDGFRWWIGQVAPFSGEGQGDQSNGGGWGNRTKVRIIGYHPFNEEELSNEDLPWAQVLLPTTSGSGAGSVASNAKLRPSDSVFGFFLDGDNAQLPVVIGVFGRTSEVSSETYSLPFTPFTGYTGRMEKPDPSTLVPNESNEQSTQTQKSPRDAPKEVIDSLNQNTENINANLPPNTPKFWAETASYTGIGKKVVLANTCEDTSISSIIGTVNNLFDSLTGVSSAFLNVDLEISRAVSSIQAAANSIVGSMFTSLSNTLIGSLHEGLANLFNDVSAGFSDEVTGILAGIAAQAEFVSPVAELQNAMFCGIGSVTNGLGDMIEELLKSVIDNAQNFVSCIGTQFVGSLINSIATQIEGFLGPVLGGIEAISGGALDVFGAMTSGVSAISNIASVFDCGQSDDKCGGVVKEYTIGKGVIDSVNDVAAILENAKIAHEIGNIAVAIGTDINKKLEEIGLLEAGQESGLPECDTTLSFDIPQIRIFGGGGEGAEAEATLGNFVKNVDGRITASVIGVNLINKGSGYKYPPFVEIVDNSRTGIGAIARSKINVETGEIDFIYMNSIGENYPIGDTIIDDENIPITTPGGRILNPDTYDPFDLPPRRLRDLRVGIGTSIAVGISSIVIVGPGIGYSFGDIVVDPFDIPINTGFGDSVGFATGPNGGISQVIAISADGSGLPTGSPVVIAAPDYPEFRIRTITGFGAILKPSIGIVTFVNKLTQIIDCI
jgi:hypothetical protein